MGKTTPAIINKDYQMVPIGELIEHPQNARRGQTQAIGESIRENGFFGSLIVQEGTNHVLIGNHRLRAAIEEGLEQVPVVWISVTDAEAKRIMIADNRLSDISTWDDQALAELLQELAATSEGLSGTGFNDSDLDALLKSFQDDVPVGEDPEPRLDAAAELQKAWATKRGQLWHIGPHKLLIGDSTNADDVRRLMDGKRAVTFVTDPPYGVDYDGTNHPSSWEDKKLVKAGKKKDKNKDWSGSYGLSWDDGDSIAGLYDGFIKVAIEVAIDKSAPWYHWHAQRHQALLEAVWAKHGAFWHQTIHWVKTCPVLGYSYYMNKSESCAFGWIRGNEPRRVATDFPPNVWTYPNRGEADSIEHPTVKATELFEIPMQQHTERGDLVFEPFSGSGTQIVAAERLGRVCYALEVSEIYAAVSLQRLKDMGLEAKLEEG